MKKRKSNIELLRIISMMMIIILHFVGPFTQIEKENINNYYIIHLFESISIIGVNIFVIISSYFLFDKKSIKIRKIIDLLSIVLFYGVLFFVVATYFKIKPYSSKELFLSILPFWECRRWFVLSYIFLYLLSPYLSKLLNNIDKKSYRNLIIIMLFFTSIWPSFFKGGLRLDNGYGIISFVTLFTITGFMKRYYDKTKINNYIFLLITIICQSIVFILSITHITNTYWDYNNIFNIIGALSLFIFFKNINIDSNIINKVSTYAFSVFLIHSDFMMSGYFYDKIMHRATIINDNKLFIYVIVYTVLTYIACIIIDIIRKFIYKYTIDKLFNKIKIFNKELLCK